MINLIPSHYQYLLADETKAFCWVATVMPNGGPQLTSVWFNTDGEHILFNSTNRSAKYRYLKANPKIAIAIVDPNNPQKYMQLRGTVNSLKRAPKPTPMSSPVNTLEKISR